VAVDRAGRLVVADTGHGRIQAFESFAAGNGFRDAIGGFGAPSDVAFAPGAMLYVADPSAGRIVRVRYDDVDHDGAIDALDKCPGLPDPQQRDTDRDGLGDACDPETRAKKRLAHR
jgi:sugar lactone lactonase YvrE